MTGRAIVVVSWAGVAAFAATMIPDATGLHSIHTFASAVALALFLVSLAVWCYGYAVGIARSARDEDVNVGNLFFLHGSAPADVRRSLYGALAVSVAVAAATAWANPFAVLVPMFPLAMLPVWAARHGTFPAKPAAARR